ncbi:MAG: tandem-95 repeat protein, partial [Marinomonas sp.]
MPSFADIAGRVEISGFTGSGAFTDSMMRAVFAQAYEGSARLRGRINFWLNDPVNVGRKIELKYDSSLGFAFTGLGQIFMNPNNSHTLLYITTNGEAVAHTPLSVLVHELGHAIGGVRDDPTYANLKGDNIDQFVNDWYDDLNIPKEVGYLSRALVSDNILIEGRDYTEGKVIANAIVDRGFQDPSSPVDTINTDFLGNSVVGPILFVGSSQVNDVTATGDDDFIYGGGGDDELKGEGGDDNLFGEEGGDFLTGGDGKDRIFGGDGNDYVEGGGQDDTLFGESGEDLIFGDGGKDYIDGGAGDDDIEGGVGDDTIHGGDGNDEVRGDSGADKLYGDAGDDTLFADGNDTVLNGGAGYDIVDYTDAAGPINWDQVGPVISKIQEIVGSTFDDNFVLPASLLSGYTGLDEQIKVQGAEGDDRILGNAADNNLDGGVGDDTLFGGAGDDTIVGGAGDDRIEGDSSALLTPNGNDQISGGSGDDIIDGQGGDDIIRGDQGNDRILGGDGADKIYGGTGNDILVGAVDEDELRGGSGNDILDAAQQDGPSGSPIDNTSSDQLWGGSGNDTFLTNNGDVINDPDRGDRIKFEGVLLTGGVETEEGSGVYEADNGFKYTLTGTDLLVEDDDFLTDSITIKNFTNGSAGIRLKKEDDEPDKDGAEEQRDPLIIDLNGDRNVITSMAVSNVYFDLDNDGFAERVAWAGSADGFLVRDLNGNGSIDDGSEMFGTGQTDEVAGSTQLLGEAGFVELSALDSNGDGAITALDVEFDTLRVWVDANGDAATDDGELVSLGDLGIVSIGLTTFKSDHLSAEDDTSIVTRASNALFADGATATVYDAYLSIDQYDAREILDPNLDLSSVSDLPRILGAGSLSDLDVAMARDAGLEELVRTFTQLNVSEIDQAHELVQKIVLRWTGGDAIDPEGRGANINARWLHAIEKLTGAGFEQAVVGTNPRADAASLLIAEWADLIDRTTAQLLGQTDLGAQFLPGLEFEAAAQFVAQEGTQLATLLENVASNAPAEFDSKLRYWKAVWGTLQQYTFALGVTDAELNSALDQELADQALNLTAEELGLAIFVGDASNFGVASRESVIGQAGYPGDRILIADGAETVLAGGQGNERFIVTSTVQSLLLSDSGGGDTLELNDWSREETVVSNELLTFSDNSDSGTVNASIGVELSNNGRKVVFQVNISDGRISSPVDVIQFGEASKTPLIDLLTNSGPIIVGGAGASHEFTGTSGDEFYIARSRSDLFTLASNTGDDVVIDSPDTGSPNDALFVDADPANVVLSASGSRGQNLKVQIVGGGSITFLGQFSDDASRVESVTFADGTVLTAAEVFASVNTGSSKGETLDGTYQDDVIDGQGGSDTLRGGYGTDRYVIRSGYGLTTISDGQGPIVVEFDGSVDRDNLEFSSADGNLNIVDTLTGDRVVVQGESASSATLIEIGGETIEPLRELVQSALLAGTTTNHTIYGTAASESLFGTDEKDLIVGNGGSDSLFGRGGNDTYHLSEGKVRIIDADFGFDTITVDSKYSIDDLTFVRQNGSQLIRLRIGGSDLQIDLRNRTATDGSAIIGDSDVEQIVFADGTSIDLTSGQVITGDSGDNILFSYATEFQVFAPGAGNDRIFALRNGHKLVLEEGFGHDEFYHDTFDVTDIEFSGIDFDDNVTFVRSGYDLVVSVTDNDTLTLKGIFEPLNDGRKFSFLKFANESLYLPSVIEQIAVSTDGDDIMFGRSDLDGGAGNDVLIGTRDVNNYRFGRGFGHDVIKEQDSNFGTNDDADTLTLIGLNQEDVDFLRDPSDPLSIIIRIRDTGETLTLDGTPFDDFEYNLGDGFSDGDQFGGHWIERIIFEDGSELTQVELEQIVHDSGATDGADTLFNFGTSNDSNAISPGAVLDGGLGNDTYANQFREINVRMTPGSGTDTVLNGGKLRVQVTVHLEGLEAANLAIYSETREGQRVTVLRAITGEEIVVEGGLNEADADGRQISIIIKDEAGQFFSASRQGALVSASNPTDGADLINGQSSSGGGGVDGLETPGTGGPVDDTFDPGEGDDVVFGRGGSDTLVFEKGDGLDRLVGTSSYRVTLGAGLNADDFTFEWLNDGSQNVLLSFNDSNDGIIVDAKQIEQILYDDGTQITFGEGDPDQFVELNSGETLLSNPAGDNVISSLAGGTIVGLSGASGQDTFSDVVFSDGVLEETPAGQAWIPNSILLQDASSLSEFEFVQDTSAPADLVIRNLATGSTMRVVGQFLGGNSEPIDPWSNVSMQPNGSPDWSSLDLNSDGVFDLAFLDTDNDGVPNWLSPDADGDGVSDWQADSETTLDVDGDGVADVIAYDDNEDGIYDAFDIPDSDEQFSDGIYFYDDDGDNEIDFYGTFFGDEFEVPRNADGSINWAAIDANQDGESDIAVIDLDGDGTPNWDNPDLDGDGEADWTISSFDTFSNNFVFAERFVDEASGETWHKISDHNLSFLVRDSDGDGIPDQYALDEDQDYRPDIAPEPFVVGHFGFELSNPFGPPQISFTDWSDILPLVVQRDESAANQDQTIDLQAARPGPSSEADFLFVGAGETIDGLGGNDVILASEGQATIVFGSGSGKDILVGPEGYNNAQNNTVQLSGISGLEEIELLESANGQDLLLRVRSTGATLMISGQLIEDSNGNTIPVVTSFTLADGTEVDWRVMHGLVSGVDTTSSPIVQGGNGGSVLDGGAGNDTLIGGTGDDIYDFGRGYDEDIIRDAGGRDLVRMAEGINLDDIAFSRTGVSGSDLLVEIAGLDRLAFTIMGQFDAPAAQIENFELADGTLFNWSDVQRFVLDSKRSTGDDIIRGFASSDLIRGGAGNDTIEGAGGNDVVDGETGRDVFELRGSQSEYEVSVVDGLVTVTDLIPGRDGVDRLSNVEEVFFRGDQSRLLITPENTAPDVEGISFVSEEDATIIIARSELLASATDQDGDALTLQEVNNQNNGQAWVGTDGNVRFRPGQDFVGTAGFDFAVADGNGAVVTARVELAITAINDAPTIGIESLEFTTIEDSMIVWSLPSNAIVDVDGDSLVVEASLNDGTPLPEWLSFDGSTFSGMPPENFNGSLDIELSVSDGTLSTNADLRINVVAVNDAPTVVSDLTDINLKAGETFLFVLPETAFVDAEGDALNFELVATDGGALPEWISVNGLELSGTAPQDFDEALDIVLIADDGRAASVATFSILPFVNTAPEVVLPLEAFVSDEDTSFSYAIPTGTFADVDGDELVLTATLPDGGELPTWLTFDGLTLAGNPPLDFNGVLSIAISA